MLQPIPDDPRDWTVGHWVNLVIVLLIFGGLLLVGAWGCSTVFDGGDTARPTQSSGSTSEWNPRESAIRTGCNAARGLRSAFARMDADDLGRWNVEAIAQAPDGLLQTYAQRAGRAMLDFDGDATEVLLALDLYMSRCNTLLK